MRITNSLVAEKLKNYLYDLITLAELVDWSENAIQEGEFIGEDNETTKDIVARIGFADVRNFGLTWEDINSYFNQLGYLVSINVTPQKDLLN